MPDITLTVSGSILWLSSHQHIAYWILFAGAYFETLVGPGFFIPGELFLIPGAILGGAHVLNISIVAAVLYGGAFLGDTSSYFIGRKIGPAIFKEGRYVFSMEHYRKGESFFKRFGHKAIVLRYGGFVKSKI